MICGLITNNLNDCQLINKINAQSNSNICYNIFTYNITTPSYKLSIPVYSIDKALLVKDTLIAFDLDSAQIFDRARAVHKVLYLEDLYWFRHPSNYINCLNALKKLQVYTRSEEHKNMLQRYIGIGSKVIEDYNLQEIING